MSEKKRGPGRPRKFPKPDNEIKTERQEEKKEMTVEEPDILESYKSGDPLTDAPTHDREYTKHNVNVQGELGEIPEPEIKPPLIDLNAEPEPQNIEPDPDLSPGFESGPTDMPIEDADKKTKRAAAKHLATTVLGAYRELNNLAKKWVQVDEEKLMHKAALGNFNMDVLEVQIPLTDDIIPKTVSIKEFLDDLNESAEEVYEVTEEFENEARPLLIEIFMRKNWGLTPEQRLLSLFVQDSIPKISALVSFKIQVNQLLNIATQILENQNNSKDQPETVENESNKSEANSFDKSSEETNKETKDLLSSVKTDDQEIKEPEEVL